MIYDTARARLYAYMCMLRIGIISLLTGFTGRFAFRTEGKLRKMEAFLHFRGSEGVFYHVLGRQKRCVCQLRITKTLVLEAKNGQNEEILKKVAK